MNKKADFEPQPEQTLLDENTKAFLEMELTWRNKKKSNYVKLIKNYQNKFTIWRKY
jgi:hypothetical protein